MAIDGSVAPEIISATFNADRPIVTRDGRFLVTPGAAQGRTTQTLWRIELAAPHTATQLSSDAAQAADCQIAPDGRWLMWRIIDGNRQDVLLLRVITDGGKAASGYTAHSRVSQQRHPDRMAARRPRVPLSPEWPRCDRRSTLQPETAALGTRIKLFTIPPIPQALRAVAADADGTRFVVAEAPFASGRGRSSETNRPGIRVAHDHACLDCC